MTAGYIRTVSRDPAKWDSNAWVTYERKDDDNDWRHIFEGRWFSGSPDDYALARAEEFDQIFKTGHPWLIQMFIII